LAVSTLVLLRHGQSVWNEQNLFTGWVDVDLSPTGEREAREAGELIAAEKELALDVVHTSVLTRAVRTANLALDAAGRSYLPVERHWRLNERHYGALQGLNKKETADKFGLEQVTIWRRSYSIPPAPVDEADPNHPVNDPRYALVPRRSLPATECLADVVQRFVPYFEDAIAPQLLSGKTVFVVAHGNSLRALRKYLENMSEEEIVATEIPTGIPFIYELGDDLSVKSFRFLGDPDAAAAAAEAVRRQAG
jgi:2,3-bisphosphoglycerate-dependent phosphoglycerate mutase